MRRRKVPSRRRFGWLLVALLGLGVAPLGPDRAPASADAGSRRPDADSLYRRALAHLAEPTPEHRQQALRDLDEAARLARTRTDILHAVAWTYAAMGHHARARGCLDRIARQVPDDADAQYRLGRLWKWEWLASLDPSSYRKAMECLLRSCRLDARNLEARLAVTALALARHNVELGRMAARSAVACDPAAFETALAVGCAAYRAGALTRADSAFREAASRLPADLRRRFTDLQGIAFDAPSAPLDPEQADRAANAFWGGRDPDLTTSENEARLDFLARVAHAVLLFRDQEGVRWDLRAELFARYGIPTTIELPAPHGPDEDKGYLTYIPAFSTNSPGYPYRKQTWIYPELGLRVELWDPSLRESYRLAVSAFVDTDRRPNPARLAGRPDLVAMEDGLGVYRALPPGVTPLPVRGGLAHFPADSGVHLVAHLEAAGDPSENLWGSWIVVGTDGRPVARGDRALSASACDPTEKRIVQFDAEIPPGDYQVHLTVDDRRGRRGIVRLESRVEPPAGRLAMSELVMLCGPPRGATPGGPVLFEPQLERRVIDSRTISVYFEVHHLTLDPDGRSRFAYHYAVRRVDPDERRGRRVDPAFEASREEEHVGAHRRQFVSVPVPSLARGTYDLEIVVRDLRSGVSVMRSVRLAKP